MESGMSRRKFLYAAAAAYATAGVGTVHATEWPHQQPLTIINPYPPGGIVDILARLVAEGLSKQLDESVIVESKPGAGGNIGTALAARSKNSGYTLLLGASGPLAINSSL